MNNIPVHKLQDKTDLGFQLKAFDPEYSSHERSTDLGAHRDDHYLFFLIMEGSGSMLVDFREQTLHQNQLYYILPDQVHYRIVTYQAKGWFLAIDTSLIEPTYRDGFENWLGFHSPVTLADNDLFDYNQLLNLLYTKLDAAKVNVLHALLGSFLAMAADSFADDRNVEKQTSRPAELAMKFKKLLKCHIRQHKSPAAYAQMLYVSEPYLNESLKKITGSPVTFWIKQEILTEAKRLLYFSDMNVKQIANELGFENHSYFCRFFKKEADMPALSFRKKIRDPSFAL